MSFSVAPRFPLPLPLRSAAASGVDLGLVMGPMARRAAQPGAALSLLPAAELPET